MLAGLKENERLFIFCTEQRASGADDRYVMVFLVGIQVREACVSSNPARISSKVYKEGGGCDRIGLDKATNLEDVFVVTRNSTTWDQRMCGRINWVRNVCATKQRRAQEARTSEVDSRALKGMNGLKGLILLRFEMNVTRNATCATAL
jgi:hypothetical protein